jgi:hypothetical protein
LSLPDVSHTRRLKLISGRQDPLHREQMSAVTTLLRRHTALCLNAVQRSSFSFRHFPF